MDFYNFIQKHANFYNHYSRSDRYAYINLETG
jgi:hypothetical protein